MLQGILQRIRTPENAPDWSLTSALLFAFGYIIVWIAAQALGVAITGGDLNAPSPEGQAVGALIASAVMAFVVVQWVHGRLGTGWEKALHLETSHTLPLFLCVLIGLGGAWAIDLFGVLLHLKGDQIVPPVFTILVGPVTIGWIVAAVTAIVVQPLGEELLLRGLVYPALGTAFGNVGALLLTTAIGTLLSLILAGPLLWYALIQPLLMNLLITFLRAHTRSTQMAIVARSAFGLFFVLSALISARF